MVNVSFGAMKRFSPFLLSLTGQCVLLACAMCFLDSGRLAIAWACACAVWDLLLIADWGASNVSGFRHQPIIELAPVWVSLVGPVLLSLPAGWVVAYLATRYGS